MPAAYYRTPIGIAEITEDDGYITSLSLLDVPAGDDVVPPVPLLQLAIQQLDEYFEGKRLLFDLPLKQSGTPFQHTVWAELTKIKYGTTITYLQQSRQMNNPLGIRAIASANGKNSLAIIVPCHRVVGSDGSLTGYASGVWRKQWLLDHERKIAGVGQTKLVL